MILDDYNALNGLLEEFRQEADEVDVQIQNILRQVREAEIYLKTIMGSEPDDFKVFSPRKAEVIYKEEIEKTNVKIDGFIKQNNELGDKKNILSGRIHMIEDILAHYNSNFMSTAESAESLHISTMESLKQLIDKIELNSAYIDRNPIQAKQDYIIVGKCLKSIIDKIQDTVWTYK